MKEILLTCFLSKIRSKNQGDRKVNDRLAAIIRFTYMPHRDYLVPIPAAAKLSTSLFHLSIYTQIFPSFLGLLLHRICTRYSSHTLKVPLSTSRCLFSSRHIHIFVLCVSYFLRAKRQARTPQLINWHLLAII